MTRNHLLALSCYCLIWSPLSFGVNLVEVYQLAQNEDPQLKGAEAARAATFESKPQAWANLLPDVKVRANFAQNFQTVNQAQSQFGQGGQFTSDFLSYDYTLNITQPIFHRDRFVQLKQADSLIKQAEADYAAAQQDLMVRVTNAYFNVLGAIDGLSFANAEKKALEQQLEQAQQRFEVGLIAITDVQEAQAGYDLAAAQEIAAQNELDNSGEALREITGEYFTDINQLSEEMPLVAPEPADIEKWGKIAQEQNLKVTSALYLAEANEKEIAKQSSGHYPTLDMVASHGFSHTGGRFGSAEIDDSQIGLALNVPIYQGGLVTSKTREAQYKYKQSLEQLKQQQRAAFRLAHEAYHGVMSGISQVRALKQAVVSNETAVKATQAGFEVGTRTGVDVVTTERELLRARRDYAKARYKYIVDTLRLKQAAGTLNQKDLGTINSWLSAM